MLTRQGRCGWVILSMLVALLSSPAVCETTMQVPQPVDLGAGVDIVTVDAIVLDDQGLPVRGLTPQDFIIKEEDVPQEIVNFEAVDLAPEPEQVAAPSSQVTSHPGPPATEPTRAPDSRRIMIVFDDLHLTQLSATRAREIVNELLDSGLVEGDQVRLTSTASLSAWAARAPEGLEDLKRFVSHLTGRKATRHPMGMTDFEAMRIALYNDAAVLSTVFVRMCAQGLVGNQRRCEQDAADLDSGRGISDLRRKDPEAVGGSGGRAVLQAEAQAIEASARAARIGTLQGLRRVIAAAGAERGRKNVFILSEGFLDDEGSEEWRAVLDAARRANAVIYFVDPRVDKTVDPTTTAEVMLPVHASFAGDFYGLQPLDSRGAAALAYATGGDALTNPASAAEAMDGILDRSRTYYLLAFEPRRQKRDGKYRKLEVEVQRPGVKVIARRGYYAPKDGESEESDAGRRLLRAVDSPVDARAVPLRLAAYVLGPAANERVALLVAAEIEGSAIERLTDGQHTQQHLDWALVAVPRDGGRPVAVGWPMDVDLPPDAVEFFETRGLPSYRDLDLPPGTYQLRVAVDHGGRVGSATTTVEVPTIDAFRISTPILSDSANPATGDRAPQPVPVAHEDFPSGATLLCLYGVYGAKDDPATGHPRVQTSLSVGLVGQTPMIQRAPIELRPGPDGSLSETIPLVLRGATPGRYAMSIRVEDLVGGATAERHELFTVR